MKDLIKKDCFGYTEKNGRPKCTALNGVYCKRDGKCHFYKTLKQFVADAGNAQKKNGGN